MNPTASVPAAAPTTPVVAPAAPPTGAAPASSEERLAFLFRHSKRAGRVHVLQHLIGRYRAGEGQ
jgi:hypothetical protein